MRLPPNTFFSVVRELRAGLTDGTVSLRPQTPVQLQRGVGFRENSNNPIAMPIFGRIFFLLIPKRTREHLVGDLEEEYRTIVLPGYGRFRAQLWYLAQMIVAVGSYTWMAFKRFLGFGFQRKLHRR
jgi:hypothetical protein